MSNDKKKYPDGGALNFPNHLKLRLKGDVEEVFDPLRKKWVVLTPEEAIRQIFTAWLIETKGYPAGRMANEVGLKLNGMTRRCDTVVYNASLSPVAIVEYKAPSVNITQAVFDQIARYNLVVRARVLIVTNGREHYCCRYTDGNYYFIKEIPPYDAI